MNQELEQYLRFFIDHRQNNQPEQLASAEFAINNKAYSTTKVSPFIANYEKNLRMGIDIKRKGQIEKVMKFVERMKKVQEEIVAALKRAQEKMKQQANRGRKKAEVWKVENKVMLSMKDLMFKEQPLKKLVD